VDDAQAIERELDGVAAAAPIVRGATQVVHGNKNWHAPTHAVTAAYFAARAWKTQSGHLFEQGEGERAEQVVLLGGTVAQTLFGDADPTGEFVRLNATPARVVGVMERKGQSAFGFDEDNVVFVPLEVGGSRLVGRNLVRPDSVNTIFVRFEKTEDLADGIQQISALLRQRHDLPPETPNDFGISNLTEVASKAAASDHTLGVLLVAVSAVSLVVGGIGILNVMLVSVTERTKEIGLRLALGARRRDILQQFLIEAVTLALVGGIVGIPLGVLLSRALTTSFAWPMLFPMEAAIFAVMVAGAVGALFGYYPARRAARLSPMDALRRE
jgi:putative ABC transport system permease protein